MEEARRREPAKCAPQIVLLPVSKAEPYGAQKNGEVSD